MRRLFSIKFLIGFCLTGFCFTGICFTATGQTGGEWIRSGAPGALKLHPGDWRVVLLRKDGGQIVFNFELRDSAG